MTLHLSRYRIILPAEHGSWSLLLTPFLIGTGVAWAVHGPASMAGLALILTMLTALSAFLLRQPLTLWARISRGKGRKSDLPAARFWSILLAALLALTGIGLLALGRWALLWMLIPVGAVLGLTLALTLARGTRQLLTEIIGVAGLALTAPTAVIAVTGQVKTLALTAWAIAASHSILSILYVRLRINRHHNRTTASERRVVLILHGLGLIAALAFGWLGGLPWLLTLAAALMLVRALALAHRPSIPNVKRFGFAEMGFALLIVAVIVVGFVMVCP